MTAFGFRRTAAETAEAAWGTLQQALHRWVLAHGGSPLLARIAAWASLADLHADAALALQGEDAGSQGMAPLSAGEIAMLRDEAMVGDGTARSAFVLDARDRFYLWRNFAREREIARLLTLRRASPQKWPEPDPRDIDHLFVGDDAGATQAQRQAVRQLPGRRFGVLTGGPGTGKTTSVLRVLVMAQRQRIAQGMPAARIAIAAPTGKAAQRLEQALHAGRARLQARLHGGDWQAALEALPANASTVHRLLGYNGHSGRHGRNAEHPLDADIVVVDEASMLDLALLEALLHALRDDAHLLLVGDADQLTSVGTGSVLLDMVGAMAGTGDLARLRHGFRTQSSALAAAIDATRRGDLEGLRASIDGEAVVVEPVATARQADLELHAWAHALADTLSPHRHAADDSARLAALDALATRQLLCALRDGPFGIGHANRLVEARLRQRWGVPVDTRWYPGRAVIVSRNDYGSGLFNGDVGLCLADDEGSLQVWFEMAGSEGVRRLRGFNPASLPTHESAFAITVHKSQGSEYDTVALLLPPDPQHRILSRQLLYTGMSRARGEMHAWCSPGALETAVGSAIRRVGGLLERLEDPARQG